MTGRSQGRLPGGGTGALNVQTLLTSRKDGRGHPGENKADTLDLNQGVEKFHSLPASEPKTQTHFIMILMTEEAKVRITLWKDHSTLRKEKGKVPSSKPLTFILPFNPQTHPLGRGCDHCPIFTQGKTKTQEGGTLPTTATKWPKWDSNPSRSDPKRLHLSLTLSHTPPRTPTCGCHTRCLVAAALSPTEPH